MQGTSYRVPFGIVLVAVLLMAWLSLRPLARPAPTDVRALAPGCSAAGAPSSSEVAHAMGDAIRSGSLLGPLPNDVAPPAGGPLPSAPGAAATASAPCTDPLRLVATAAAPAGLGPVGRFDSTEPGERRRTPPARQVELAGSPVAPALAVIAAGGARAALHRLGARVGARTLVAIGAREVVLVDDAGARCTLAMSSGADDDVRGPAVSSLPRRAAGRERVEVGVARGGSTPAAGPSRGALRSALGRVRVLPQVENGRTIGVRLLGVRTSAVLGALGFEDGDVVRTVNGYSIANPDDALRAYAALRDAPRLTVALERRGAPLTLDVNIR